MTHTIRVLYLAWVALAAVACGQPAPPGSTAQPASSAAPASTTTPAAPEDPLIAGFKKTYPASVSDAVELVTGANGTMRHDMKLVTGQSMVGRAVTSLVKPAWPAQAAPA